MTAKPFVPAPNVAQVDMIYTVLGEICENVFHVHRDSGWDQTSLAALAALFITWETNFGAATRHNSTSFTKVIVRDISTQNSGRYEQSPSPAVSGTGGTAPAPNNVTIAVKHNTGLAGRSFRGRTFWIGIDDTVFAGNNITSANKTAFLSRMTTLLTTINGITGQQMVVCSKRFDKQDRAVALSTPITSFTMDSVMDSQRRRLPEHNRHRR